ncbi:hypothetical protein ACFLS8_05155 [Chloroflexota bacterium]
MEEAKRLKRQWENNGNPPCDYPDLDKEYIESFDTGDRVCTSCGQCFASTESEQDPITLKLVVVNSSQIDSNCQVNRIVSFSCI